MSLDFTALNNIPLLRKRRTEPVEGVQGNLAIKAEVHATEPNTRPDGALQRLDREKKERENSRQMYAAYQRNIKRSELLRSEINKGLRAGEEPLAILLKALECISLMTGDTAAYTQAKDNLLTIYGYGKDS